MHCLYIFNVFLDLKGQLKISVFQYLQNSNFFSPSFLIQKQDKRNSIRHEPKKRRKDHRKIDFVELSLLLQLMGRTMCGRELKIQYNS